MICLKQTKHQTKSQFVYKKKRTSHVTKAAGIDFFYDPRKWERSRRTNRLVKNRSRKSGWIQKRSLNKLAQAQEYGLLPVFKFSVRGA